MVAAKGGHSIGKGGQVAVKGGLDRSAVVMKINGAIVTLLVEPESFRQC